MKTVLLTFSFIFPSIPRFHSRPQICFTYHNSLGRSLPIIILQSSVLPRRQCTTLSNRHRWSDFLFFLRKVHFEHGLFSLAGTVKFVQFTNCISQGRRKNFRVISTTFRNRRVTFSPIHDPSNLCAAIDWNI